MDLFNCTQLFHSVAKFKSMSKAAEHHSLSPSAVTKRIAWLEGKLSVKLFVRTTRQLSLTEAGEQYYARTFELSQQWQSVIDETAGSGKKSKGRLRIAAPQPLTNRVLAKVCCDFQKVYPNISIELEVAHFQDLPLSHADISICAEIDGFNSSSYIGRKAFNMHYCLYASPLYIQNNATICSLDNLPEHNCLYYGLEKRVTWHFDSKSIHVSGNLRTNNTEVLITAAALGQGIAYLPNELVSEEVASKKLLPILDEHHGEVIGTFIYYAKQDFLPEKIKLFIDFFKKSVA